jgi:hypothetical protein
MIMIFISKIPFRNFVESDRQMESTESQMQPKTFIFPQIPGLKNENPHTEIQSMILSAFVRFVCPLSSNCSSLFFQSLQPIHFLTSNSQFQIPRMNSKALNPSINFFSSFLIATQTFLTLNQPLFTLSII